MCFFFPSSIISVVNIFVFGGSVSARWITYEYSIDDVTATWIEVNLVSPYLQNGLRQLITCGQSFMTSTVIRHRWLKG